MHGITGSIVKLVETEIAIANIKKFICCPCSQSQSQSQSQKVLLQQNHQHTWNNTETETHWVYLPHTILASVTLQ